MLFDPESPLTIRWRYLPSLLPWLVRLLRASKRERFDEISDDIVALVSRAEAAHDHVIQRTGSGDLVHRHGWLKIARSKESLQASTALEQEFLKRHNVPFEILQRDEIEELEPALSGDITNALHLFSNRAVEHPQTYTKRIFSHVEKQGGLHLVAKAEGIESRDGVFKALLTGDGQRIEGDHLVIAAGAFSRHLANLLGHKIPLDTERGYHLMLPHPERTLTRPIYGIEEGFVLAPMRHGIRLTSGVELAHVDAPPRYEWVRRLVPKAQKLLPGLSDQIESEWQGHRPSLPDSLPVIGPSDMVKNSWFAFGHQHIGLTLGPITGIIIRDLIMGTKPPLDIAAYAPGRQFH